jgi:hypothetical protein
MSEKAQGATERLRLAIHGVTTPFCCDGTCNPDKPVTLVFSDGARFEVVRAKSDFDQEGALRPLLERSKQAPFGKGKKTRYDRRVRDALQLKAEDAEVRVDNFDPEAAGILKKVQRELVPHDPNRISAELHAVNVYTKGGHFAPHKDTPRGSDVFGTLVVCLPSQFFRGRLLLNHRGVVQKFDWGRAIRTQKQPNQLHWVAFFGDVDHQIEEIGSGARVTLSYLLRRGNEGAPIPETADEALAPRVQEAWRALLADRNFLPKGGTLAYPCCHLYHQDARFQRKQSPIMQKSVTMLKGRDHLVGATALQAGLIVTFQPYMFENCADETWQLDRFPTRNEQGLLGSQADSSDLENALPIRASSEQEGDFGVTWLEPPPNSDHSSWRAESEDDSGLPAAAHLHSCEYCPWGYFGNEASDVDLYTYAALDIKVPPFGRGLRVANKWLKRTPVKGKRSTSNRKASRGQ